MLSIYISLLAALVLFSAFFSSAETSLLSLDKIKLAHKVKRKNKKAVLLTRILEAPDEFFSTILIGNNLVNIAAASLVTIMFSKYLPVSENMILLVSTASTTIIILFFAEIIPKTYAFRFSEKMAYLYAYPIRFFKLFFFPLVKIIAFFSNFFFRKKMLKLDQKEFSPDEIKHFLESEIKFFKYSPETLRIVHEIIDVAQKDIKNVMTPRPKIVALEVDSGIEKLKEIILEHKITKIPLYRDNLNNITGVIYTDKLISELVNQEFQDLDLEQVSERPVFISEYSSLNYVIREFKRYRTNFAVILDEYGTTIGIVTLNDIFREIFGEIEINRNPIKQIDHDTYLIQGHLSVEELNTQLHLELPERKDYATLSGLFIYNFGRFPRIDATISVSDVQLKVKKMGERKIEEIWLRKKAESK
jgi:putative hemolysin